jgi:hypothetical protein
MKNHGGTGARSCLRGNKKFVSLLIFLLLQLPALSQWSDTIRTLMRGKVYPTATFDSRNSFIGDRRAHIWGIKAGVEFSGRIQFGVGYNRHDQNLVKVITYTNSAGFPSSTLGELRLSYISFYTKFVYYKTKRWKFSIIPFQVGFGNSRYVYEEEGKARDTGKRFVVIYESGVSASYKLLPWLGAGADFGYRVMLRDNPAIPENFNSPIYAFYGIIYWAEVYKLVFPESKWAKKI